MANQLTHFTAKFIRSKLTNHLHTQTHTKKHHILSNNPLTSLIIHKPFPYKISSDYFESQKLHDNSPITIQT